jgi:biopolymer transport protein ExbD
MPSKLRESTANPDDELNVDMSPMIDMVFLLLIFFIVNATAIIVKTDPDVTPPVADQAKAQEDGRGRIVVNVRTADDSDSPVFTAEDFRVILENEDAIRDYVREAKEAIDLQGIIPKLHLRGDKDTVFRHSRTAIRAAAGAGVDQVVFAVYVRQP